MDIGEVDKICAAAFSQLRSERDAAYEHVVALQTVEAVPKLRQMFEGSNQAATLFVASQALKKVLTESWNGLTNDNILEIRDFLVTVLTARIGHDSAPPFVINAVVNTLCVLVKNALLECPAFLEFPQQIRQTFVQLDNPPLASLGLMVLHSLVTEIGTLNQKRSLAVHRKVSTLFRDECLMAIFRTSLEVLAHEACSTTGPILEHGVTLASVCLGYDFVGVFPDETAEESTTVQMPSTWRAIICGTEFDVISQFTALYFACPPPHTCKVVQCLIYIASIRRSLFQEPERMKWLNQLLGMATEILQRGTWLEDTEVFAEVCRLMNRIKPNYQLTELLECENYEQWVSLCADFSTLAFNNWRSCIQGTLSLLSMWSRLVASLPYSRSDRNSGLPEMVPNLVETYLRTRMEVAQYLAEHPNDALFEDPVDDTEMFTVELDFVSQLIRSNYNTLGQFVFNLLLPLCSTYGEAVQRGDTSGAVAVVEEQLAWLVCIVGSNIRHHASSSGANSFDADQIDSDTITTVFDLITIVNAKMETNGQQAVCSPTFIKLEVAVLLFLQYFRQVHIGDSSGGKVLAKLQEKLAASTSSQAEDGSSQPPSLSDLQSHLLNLIMNKALHNLQTWGSSTKVIDLTLALFYDLSCGYNCGRQLLELPSVKLLVQPHLSNAVFPFQQHVALRKQRLKYQKTIASLLFMETSFTEEAFDGLMTKSIMILQELESACAVDGGSVLSQESAQSALVGVLYDLRGIATACVSRRTYNLFFDAMFPTHLEFLANVGSIPTLDSIVTVALLRFLSEMYYNRSQRMTYDATSVAGIHMFKHMASVLKAVSKTRLERIGSLEPGALALVTSQQAQRNDADLYNWMHKPLYLMFQMVDRAISGGYCNFGVFELYKDPVLNESLTIGIQLLTVTPFEELSTYPHLAASYYSLLEHVFQNHTQFFINVPSSSLRQVLHCLEAGIGSNLPTTTMCSACNALSSFLTFIVTQQRKHGETIAQLCSVVGEDSGLMTRLLGSVFSNVVYDEGNNQWTFAQPLLPLIVVHEPGYVQLRATMIQELGYAPERQAKLTDAFDRLMDGVEKNLERRTKDKFMQNLTVFRHAVKAIL